MSNLSKKILIEMFSMLLKLRRLEERVVELSMAGEVPGWIHSYMGQEAVAVGTSFNLRPDDYIVVTHRGRAHCLAKGVDVKRYLAEIMGRKDGVCGGKSGEMHLTDKNIGLAASSGIVGGILSCGLGLAFSAQYRGTDQVTVASFGDGATNQGTFHECLNLASLWRLPIVLVCERNEWAEFTPTESSMRVPDIVARAAIYGIPGKLVDGDDVIAMYDAIEEAVKRARKGEGPTLLECRTHRWHGHWIGDDQKYRPPEELAEVRDFDPLSRFQSKLTEEGLLTAEMLAKMEQKLKKEIGEAVEFARQNPQPDAGELMLDVYCEGGIHDEGDTLHKGTN